MSKWSSLCCSVSFFLVIFAVGFAQDNNGEFKHELPEGVELVDPKSLGLTDVDLSKFLGNVKVLGGGQVGDTKTQILTVGFEGDENINFNDFTIPGLTDGNNTALPEKDKEIADMAFKKFKEFFADPNKAKQFEQGGNHNINLGFASPTKQEQNKHQLQVNHQKHPPPHQQRPQQFHIPMIQKPYTTPRTPHIHFTTNHPARYVQPPPPPPHPPQAHVVSPVPPAHNSPPPHVFNSQIKSQSPPLEFGARIPTSPNPQIRVQPQVGPPQNFHNPPQNHGHFHHQQHHRLVPQQQQHNHNQQQHQNHQQRPFQQTHQHAASHQPQPQPYLQQPPPPPQIQFIQHPVPTRHNNQHQSVQQSFPPPRHQAQAPPTSPPSPRVPVQPPQQFSQPQHAPAPPPSQNPQPQQEQGRIVRNQLLMESNNNRFQNNGHFNNNHNHLQLRPPPPPSQSAHPSASNQVPVQTPAQFHGQLLPGAATATSHVYIQRGSKKTTSVQHTNFHPQFQPPTRMSKDFTPTLFQITTTSRPTDFDVTPSMALIPLSTNENAITDPTRMLQLRLYQQQKAQASNTQQSILPLQATTPAPTIAPTTTPISITTSYPEIDGNQQQFGPSANYDHQIGNPINDNDIFNKGSFALQTQQQHQLHNILQQPSSSSPQQSPQSQNAQNHQPQYQHLMQSHNNQLQPTVFYTQDHRRPPRQGSQNRHRPGFQFHLSHDLGQPPRLHMNPDPKSLLNTIRRKRGYRRLSNLFNKMFRWDRH